MTTPVHLDLSEPPEVVNQGLATHGVGGRLTDEFLLPELWSLHLYRYDATLEVDGVTHRISPGTVSLVPPASRIVYSYLGPSQHLYAHLRPPSAAAGTAYAELSLTMSPGADLPAVTDLMQSAVASAAARPERTRADIWMMLLRLADRPRPVGPRATTAPAHDHVVAAMSYIESRLAGPLTVPEVARAVGLSHSQLTRVFTAETGQTVVGYLRRRRVEHAQHLLAHSTMSITAIAATVGIPDLQAFNKTCRAVTGRSPRQLRHGMMAG